MQDPYAAHVRFVLPARASAALWRVLVVAIGFEVIFALSPQIVAAFLPTQQAVDALYDGIGTFGTLAQLFTFAVAGAGFLLLVRRVHGLSLGQLLGGWGATRAHFWPVLGAVGLLLLVQEVLPPWIDLREAEMAHSFGVWLALVPVTLLALLVQVSTEELFFRGYLQQQFACLFPQRWIWMGLPSVMFGVLHYGNGFGAAEGVLWAAWAAALGLACADLTARVGNLGPAIALHLANNAFAILIVSIEGWPASGLSLLQYPYEDPSNYADGLEALLQPWAVLQAVLMALSVWLMWMAARIAVRR